MKCEFDPENPVAQLKSYKEVEVKSKNKPSELECSAPSGLKLEDKYELDPPDGGYGWVILGKYQLLSISHQWYTNTVENKITSVENGKVGWSSTLQLLRNF